MQYAVAWWLFVVCSLNVYEFSLQCTVYYVQIVFSSVQSTVYSVQCTLCSVLCILYSVLCAVCLVQLDPWCAGGRTQSSCLYAQEGAKVSLYSTLLSCNRLYSTILYSTILCCTLLYSNVLYCTQLYRLNHKVEI